jgi:hypothetical protein
VLVADAMSNISMQNETFRGWMAGVLHDLLLCDKCEDYKKTHYDRIKFFINVDEVDTLVNKSKGSVSRTANYFMS